MYIDDLKAKALAATQGKWILRDRGVICGGPLVKYSRGSVPPQIVMCCGGEHIGHEQKTANEQYIVAASPENILNLIDELEAVKAERDALKSKLEAMNCTVGVGDGAGNLFVHGDYDSVKAVQGIIIERDALKDRVGQACAWAHNPEANAGLYSFC